MIADEHGHTGSVHLTKHHGLGNDFLITFVDAVPAHAPELAIELCHRRTGIGADGLIFGVDDRTPPQMHLFNSDGSSAEVSGNGLRCFVQALAMRRGVTELDIDIETAAGVRACTIRAADTPATVEASADMGEVTEGDRPDSMAFLDSHADLAVRRWTTAAVGNPHVVIEVADPHAIDLATVGPEIERHFPHGVNVHMVRASGPDAIELRVWERGAGITAACGSGATVAAQRMHEWGAVGPSVEVSMPGGSARVDVATESRRTAVLSGSAVFVAAIEVPHG